MEQIPQSIINSILGGALAALGWFARQIWDLPGVFVAGQSVGEFLALIFQTTA